MNLTPACFMFLTTPVFAEEVIAENLTWLDAKDTVTSKGVKLDTSNPVFNNRNMPAKLPQLYKAGDPVEAYIHEDVMSDRRHYVFVGVLEKNGRITHVNVCEGVG